MKPFRLNRRTFLRGAGFSVALPTLDAMIDGHGRWFNGQAYGAAPVRVMAYHFPHGAVLPNWTPATPGKGYALTPSLMPLAAFQNDYNIISGINLDSAKSGGPGGDHARGIPSFATASVSTGAGAGGPSFEQQLANELGGTTKFRSLVANNEPPGTITEGASTAHMNNISWSAAGKFVPPDRDPMAMFARLVTEIPTGGATSGPTPEFLATQAQERSILDHVTAEIATLNAKVGAADKSRLDDHLSGLREIEKQLNSPPTAVSAGCSNPGPPGDTSDITIRAKTFLKIIATAFKCDLTRYASFASSNGFDTNRYTQLSGLSHWHDITHMGFGAHYGPGADIETKYVTYFASVFASLLAELKAAPEGGGTVLDNCLIYYGSEMAEGWHHVNNMPIILAGKAGGKHPTGSHVMYTPHTPMAKLFLTILKLGGSSATRFGMNGDAVLPNLGV